MHVKKGGFMSFESGRESFDAVLPDVSIVVPFLDEAETLQTLRDRIDAVLAPAGIRYEIVFVNDGSRDGSEAVCRAMVAANDNVVLVNFRTNFGKSAAL